jgi:hypothetical protein
VTNNSYTLPIARFQPSSHVQGGNAQSAPTVGSVAGVTGNGPSFAQITKLLGGGHHHHSGGAGSTKSAFDSNSSSESTDAFGVSSAGSSPSVDAFGAASSKPSTTSSLVSAINDPFSSLASNYSIQAQLQSQQILDV